MNNSFLGHSQKGKGKRMNQSQSGSSSISTSELQSIIDKLRLERVRDTTKKNYYSVWKTFNEFYIHLDIKPKEWADRLTLFIGYLIEFKKVKSQTVRSYISAIKTVLKDDGIEIQEDAYLLSSLVRACKYKNDTINTRLPIQKSLLIEILKFTEDYYIQQGQFYLSVLFKALFISAYFGLFRVSEITMTSSEHAVRVTDVHVGKNKKFLFILRTSTTHCKSNKPQMIKISMKGEVVEKRRQQKNPKKGKTAGRFCPYEILKEYTRIRLSYHDPNEQFFIFKDYTPVSASHMHSTLSLMLKLMLYNEKLYNCHSFRIGHAVIYSKTSSQWKLSKNWGDGNQI